MFAFLVTPALPADQYFSGDGSALTASSWGASAAGPFTNAFTSGNIVDFAIANGTGTGGSITVGGINATENFTLTSPTGTISNLSNGVITISVATGKTLDLSTENLSSSATAGYVKSGNGVLATAGNTYSGGFTLNAGTVIVRGTNAMGGSATNTLTINGGIIASNATRDLSSKYGGGITVGGDFQLGAFAANSALASDTANLTFSNNIALGNATRTITLGNKGTMTLGGIISGATGSGLTFNAVSGAESTVSSNGSIAITGTANTFTGPVNINGPEVTFAGDGGLGNTANTLNIDGGRFTATTSFTLTAGRGIQVGSTSGTSISTKGSGTTLTYNGVIADKTGSTGILVKQGAGALALGGASTYSGNTSINNGTVQITTGNNRLPTGTTVSLGQAGSSNLGKLDLNGFSQQIAGLNSTSGTNSGGSKNTVTNNNATTESTLTIGGSGSYSYGDGTAANSGIIADGSGGHKVSLVKQGSGSQTLGDANTYTGTTTISGGKLFVNGSLASGSAVTVSGTGILGGSGNVGGTVAVNSTGTISPGASDLTTGLLTTGAMTWSSGGTYKWNLLDANGAAGTGYSRINASSLDLTGVSTGGFNLNLATLSAGGTLGAAANFGSANKSWTILHTTGGITNFNASDFAFNTSNLTGLNGGSFSVTESTNSNDLLLNFVAGVRTLNWTASSNTNWNTTDSNWNSGGATSYNEGDAVTFGNSGVGAVVVDAGGVTPGSVNVTNTSGSYTFSGGSINGTGSFTMSGAGGTVTLNQTNAYTGGTNVSAGTLALGGV